MPGYSFCRIYVSSEDRDPVAKIVSTPPPPLVAEVRTNENRPHDLDDFLMWPLCVEVEQPSEAEDQGIVAFVRATIAQLKLEGVETVVAAPFEDEL